MRAGVVLLLMLLMLGCAGAPVKLPIDGPQTAAAVLALLPISTVTTIQGQARLDAYVGGDRRSVTLLVLASRADKVQFQALAPTLDLLGLVSSDGSRFVTFERGSDTCQTGLACQRNLMRFVPIPQPAAAMVAALHGISDVQAPAGAVAQRGGEGILQPGGVDDRVVKASAQQSLHAPLQQ